MSDCMQPAKPHMQQVLVDTDGKLSIRGAASRWCASTNPGFKTATVHAFGVFYPGYVQNTTCKGYAMWVYGNVTGSRHGLGLGPCDSFASYMALNGAMTGGQNYLQYSYGSAHLGGTSGFHVWDLLSNTGTLRHDTTPLTPGFGTTAITYPADQPFLVGDDGSDTAPFLGRWRALVLYSSARSDRDGISNFLISDYAVIKLPTTTLDGGGFPYTPQYFPNYTARADINKIAWWQEHGGYPWSIWYGNVANASTLARFEVHPLDHDVIVNGSERAENGGKWNGQEIVPGTDFDMFAQFLVEPGPMQAGDWCVTFQFHYGAGEVTGSPDLVYVSLLRDTIRIVTGADGRQTPRNSPMPFSRNTWYAMRVLAHASSDHASDTLQVWLGPNGGTLAQIVDIGSSQIFNSNAWNAYLKRGIYRGFPGSNAGALAIRVANYQFSQTAGAFASYVTSQPALPTH
jgi:hypothetical protein